MSTLLDTHYHFDFLATLQIRSEFVTRAADKGIRVVAQTLTPSSFVTLMHQRDQFGDASCAPLWSLGFHPWFISDDDELALFSEAVVTTRFIGEIGLDFHPRRLAAVDESRQRRVLHHVLQHTCRAADQSSSSEPYVLSIHAVRSAGVVVQMLTECEAWQHNVVPVMHRFSGTSDELTDLIAIGGYLSIHPRMLDTKRGRAYARQVPADRLLLESDLPEADTNQPAVDAIEAVASSLTDTLAGLSTLRRCDMAPIICDQQRALYGVH